MRVALVTCFDVGVSYGLDDEIFPPALRKAPDEILEVGITNPLGEGLWCDVRTSHPAVIAAWCQAAREMALRPEMELGWVDANGVPRDAFTAAIASIIREEDVARCELTIYAVGTVLLWLEIGPGLHDDILNAVAKCWEYAAYRADIGKLLWETTLRAIPGSVRDHSAALNRLSERPEPEVQSDRTGYSELKLITSFTRVVLCIDAGDDSGESVCNRWQSSDGQRAMVNFEYHGQLYFGWSTCVICPRDVHNEHDQAPAAQQIKRMVGCITIAHVFLGTCAAFERLFAAELKRQVGHYVGGRGAVRSARSLNQLRTLARAVISLTDYARVAETEEDQAYFAQFESFAHIANRHAVIKERCDVLYDVQLAEARAEDEDRKQLEEQRQNRLNLAISFLTGLTFVAFLVDSFGFVWAGSGSRADGLYLRLGSVVLLLLTILLLLVRLVRVPRTPS